MIDWEAIIRIQNKEGRNFKTRKEMLETLYAETRSMRKSADILCISYESFKKALKDEGIKSLPIGGANYKGKADSYKNRVQALDKDYVESHSIEEIMMRLGQANTRGMRTNTKRYLKEIGYSAFYERDL